MDRIVSGAIVAVLALTSCTTGPVGANLISKADGATLPATIDRQCGTGNITAHDPRTGESFAGTYTGEGWGCMTVTIGNAERAPERPSAGPDNLATLRGDAGTVISCTLQAGARGHGHGECESNRGERFNLQF